MKTDTRGEKWISRYNEMVYLRSNGYTLTEIGSHYGITKQCVSERLLKGMPIIQVAKPKPEKTIKVEKYSPEIKNLLMSLSGRERTRMLVRIRDNFTCKDCGKYSPPDLVNKVRMYDVHHLNGLCGKKSRAYDRVSSISGLVTLCHKCHFNRPEHTIKKRKL